MPTIDDTNREIDALPLAGRMFVYKLAALLERERRGAAASARLLRQFGDREAELTRTES